MTERIYAPDGKTALERRRDGKRYSHVGVDPDGAARIVEMSAQAQAAREAEEEAERNKPEPEPPREILAELDALEARVAALEGR